MITKIAHHYEVRCDECGLKVFEVAKNRGVLAKTMRNLGWSIGKYTLCPKCNQQWK